MTKLVGSDLKKITPKILDEAASKKDKLAMEIWREAGFHLGSALAGFVNVMNPEKIIIGGGISAAGKVLFDSIKRRISQRYQRILQV